MKIAIVERKNGKVRIEMNDDDDVEEVLKEHEIKSYLKLTILKNKKLCH